MTGDERQGSSLDEDAGPGSQGETDPGSQGDFAGEPMDEELGDDASSGDDGRIDTTRDEHGI